MQKPVLILRENSANWFEDGLHLARKYLDDDNTALAHGAIGGLITYLRKKRVENTKAALRRPSHPKPKLRGG